MVQCQICKEEYDEMPFWGYCDLSLECAMDGASLVQA
jgi:hypothetical protein